MIDFDNDFGDLLIQWSGVRKTAGQRVDYQWVPGSESPITFMATPHQPVGDTEINLVKLEDGEKIEDMRKLYTSFALQTRKGDVDADALTDPDSGEQYEVRQVSDRDRLGGHYKAIIKRIQWDSGV